MKQVFINLPVIDIERSMHFYLELGFTLNPLFTDEHQKCVMWSDAIYVMLQSQQFSNAYLNKKFTDPKLYSSASHTLPVESIEKVNEMVEHGLKAGGVEPVAALDEGFMYLRTIEDVDGYAWGIMHLDIDKFKILKQK